MQRIIKKIWPAIIILFVWFIFSFPYFIKGKIPYSATYQVNSFAPWDAYPQYRGPVKNGAIPDITTQIYPWKYLVVTTYKRGQIPLWNPYSFSGTPLLANYQSAVLSPLNGLFFLFPFRDGWSLLILFQPLLSSIFMYLYLRSLMISKWGSLVGSVAFMFCGFMTVWMDYGTLDYAILYLPLALFSIEKFYSYSQVRYLLLFTLTIPLSFFSGHFQISLYFILSLFVYEIYKGVSKKNKKKLFVLLLFTLFGLLDTLPQVLPSLEFYQQSLRSNFYIKSEVIPWGYLPTLFAPDFYGNPVTRNDWFGHYAEWNTYIGLATLLFSWYALKLRKRFIYFLFTIGTGSLLIALPTPLFDGIEFLHIPVLATSAVSRIVVVYSFFFTVLAGFGFDAFLADIKKKNSKPLIIILGIFSIVFCSLWVSIFTKKILPFDKIVIAKQNLILPTLQFIIIIVLSCVGVLVRKQKTVFLLLPLLFFCLVSFDMLRFATKWQPFDPKELAFIDTPVEKFISTISDSARAIGNYGAELSNYYRVPSLEGYDALYIDRYGQFISTLNTGKIHEAEHSVVIFPTHTLYTPKVINLLNVGYVIHKVSDDYTSWTFPYWDYPRSQFQKLYDDGAYRIYKNTMVFPRVFLVNDYLIKTNPQSIFTNLFANNFALQKRIILEKNPGFPPSNNTIKGYAKILTYSSNKITVVSSENQQSLLFLSDPYYPGWSAYVDGKRTEIFRADYAFRALNVPAGNHAIVFIYQPLSFFIGIWVAVISLFSTLVSLLFLRRKKDLYLKGTFCRTEFKNVTSFFSAKRRQG